MREKRIFIVSIIVTLLVGVTGTYYVDTYVLKATTSETKEVKEVSISEADTIKSSIDKVYDSVVYIESYKGVTSMGSGTGFIYKKSDTIGYVMTNNHVIEGATTVKITNNDGKTVTATLLGTDEYADIAVLSIPVDAVMAVSTIGDSTKAEVGDTLFTIGSPMGIDYMGTVTKGILSGKDRTVEVSLNNGAFMMEVLQTDAAINPGNSGGPLCNINGQVIGVNSMKLVEDTIEGMGFAIPIEIAMSTAAKLEKGEKVVRPLLGVELLGVDESWQLYQKGIYIDEAVDSGVALVTVQEDSSAAVAGLKKGDVIISIDDKEIDSVAHFRYMLYKYTVGDTIKVKYYRDNKITEVSIKLTKAIE